jgi:uncharacterized protein YjgD (DUF1641 family)
MSGLDGYFEEVDNVMNRLVENYFIINERKKKDEKWLKENSPLIKKAMDMAGKDKKDYGSYRVSCSAPDTGKFNEEKVLDYILANLGDEVFDEVTTVKLNEEALEQLITNGTISIDDLKNAAWEDSKGTPRLVISKLE